MPSGNSLGKFYVNRVVDAQKFAYFHRKDDLLLLSVKISSLM